MCAHPTTIVFLKNYPLLFQLEALLEDTTLDLGWSVKQSIAATSVRTQNNMAWFAFQGQALEQVLNGESLTNFSEKLRGTRILSNYHKLSNAFFVYSGLMSCQNLN